LSRSIFLHPCATTPSAKIAMVLLPTVKLAISVACVVASLLGLKHAGMLGPEKLGPLKHRLGKGPHGVSFENYQHSTCQACLESGKDFCISSNRCTPRATFTCKGPEDHISSDLEFVYHGKANIGGFFARAMKRSEAVKQNEQDDASAVKQMLVKVPEIFRDAGMPDDRIDYILMKWVKSVFPEALDKGKSDVDSKDCYFDKECHAKVDWEKISKIKGGFFVRLKMYKEKDDVGAVKQMLVKVHEMFREAGMPDDRIDYILMKWVKMVFPEALTQHIKSAGGYSDKPKQRSVVV